MKKIKMLLYSAAFVLALSASFAFKPAKVLFTAYLPTASCSTQTQSCTNVHGANCLVGGIQAYQDQGHCLVMAFRP
jgi:hypothetical protein